MILIPEKVKNTILITQVSYPPDLLLITVFEVLFSVKAKQAASLSLSSNHSTSYALTYLKNLINSRSGPT